MVMNTIFISIASYRDPDLINTVKSAYNNAKYPENLFFSIVSQDDKEKHPDLNFIPENQIRYVKHKWEDSLGTCWAREIASRDINTKYFFQIDSHSRFKKEWDEIILNQYLKYQEFWGNRIVMSNYPGSLRINWETEEDELHDWPHPYKLGPKWDEAGHTISAVWIDTIYYENGEEVYFASANNLFCESELIKEVPYDKELYFTGEEPTLTLRFYTSGIKIINPSVPYMYTNYDRENGKREFHWVDHNNWWELNKKSYGRIKKIMLNDKSMGIFGVKDDMLYNEYQEKTGISFHDKKWDL